MLYSRSQASNVGLQIVEVGVGFAPKGDGEEFLLDGPNEALDKAIGLRAFDRCAAAGKLYCPLDRTQG